MVDGEEVVAHKVDWAVVHSSVEEGPAHSFLLIVSSAYGRVKL